MRILIIGGTGFIGPHVVGTLIDQGHDVALLTRPTSSATLPPGAQRITGDRRQLATSAAALRAFRPDVVADLILSSGTQAQTLMDVFRGVARRVVALSSIDVYRALGVIHGSEDGPPDPVPLREDSPLRTRTQTYPPAQAEALKGVFGWFDDEYDKIPVERAILGDSALPGTVLRLPMVYGPGDRLHRMYPMLKRMDDHRRAIPMQENWANWRSPRGYVQNVAAAVALAAVNDRAAGHTYNVADSQSFSEIEWAALIAKIAGWHGDLVPVPAEHLPPSLRVPGNFSQQLSADSSRIRTELGYVEPVPRAQAMRETVKWERANPPLQLSPGQFDYESEDFVLLGEAGTALH
ncbi:MAG: NAD-dependent epimerase/dehydratase family protein [Gemmatimonadales bacterium]